MSGLSEETKRIKRMRKSYNDARKQIKEAMTQCTSGTAVHLQHIKALAELDTKERAEEIALGLSPQNLGAMTATSFVYVAHVQVLPETEAELQKILGVQMRKACKDVSYTPEDEQVRRDLEGDYPNAK